MPRRTTLTASLLVSLGVLYVGCTQNFDQFEPAGADGATATSSATGAGGAGGQGGGSVTPCQGDAECDDANPCTTDTCNKTTGECERANVADGPEPGAIDAMDDCKDRVCKGGKGEDVPDDSEIPVDDMNPCTDQMCSAGAPTVTNKPIDTSCGQGTLVCDDAGVCVGCNTADQCPDVPECQVKKCTDNQCVTENKGAGDMCSTGVCNGAAVCVQCVADANCDEPQSEVCDTVASMCKLSCPDGAKDGLETDVDCGGIATCPKCKDGGTCAAGADCMSGVCNATCQAPTCSDMVKNGNESDVDCGNTCGAGKKCADGKVCGNNNDCSNNRCTTNVCTSCNDGIKNGNESDVDCGNTCGAAKKCGPKQSCNAGNDCTTGTCNANVCAGCKIDGMKNFLEDDVDCGGECAMKCGDGKMCNANGDCNSNFCGGGGVCLQAMCGDGMKNGLETDIDCGGFFCAKCGTGKTCNSNGDCINGTCSGNPQKCN